MNSGEIEKAMTVKVAISARAAERSIKLAAPWRGAVNKVLVTLKQIWGTPDLRRKILFTGAILLIYRSLAHIPVAGVNRQALAQLFPGVNCWAFWIFFRRNPR